MPESKPSCLVCHVSSDVVPLVTLQYQGQTIFICPQHLPILIHQPSKLSEFLPGLAGRQGAQHDHE